MDEIEQIVPEQKALGGFDGINRRDRTISLWNPPNSPTDDEVIPAKDELDAKSRDITKNDAFVAGGRELHKDHIVGSFYRLNAKPRYRLLGKDEVWEEEFQREVEEKFTAYCESQNNWVDHTRTSTLTGLVRSAIATFLLTGEVLALGRFSPGRDRPFRSSLLMIDPRRLSTPLGKMESNKLRGGVEKDSTGQPIAYHIRESLPSMALDIDKGQMKSFLWKRVPTFTSWGRRNVLHLFERDSFDQTRGVSQLVTILKETKVARDFRDVVLQNAIVNATFAATIESTLPTDIVFQSLGPSTGMSAVNDYLSAIAEYTDSGNNITLDGAKIPHLYPGEKLNLTPAGQAGPLGTEFEVSMLRYLAAGLGVSYETFSKDYTKTSYSSARAAMADVHKYMQSRKTAVADKVASYAYRLWLEEAINKGGLETVNPNKDPSWYEGLNAEAYSNCAWVGADQGFIDPLKETKASIEAVNNGLSTLEEECKKRGLDWRDTLAQRAREKKYMEQLGIGKQDSEKEDKEDKEEIEDETDQK